MRFCAATHQGSMSCGSRIPRSASNSPNSILVRLSTAAAAAEAEAAEAATARVCWPRRIDHSRRCCLRPRSNALDFPLLPTMLAGPASSKSVMYVSRLSECYVPGSSGGPRSTSSRDTDHSEPAQAQVRG